MAWTTNQQLAIDAEGADILVAAGAGSGKTAVLVERIVREVLRRPQRYNIDDLLVLTFTKAAAEEMRSRLYEKLDEALEAEKNKDSVKEIYEQQVRLRRASIGTIDSFCKNLLSENVRESGIDDSFNVCDSAQRDGLLEEAAERACEEYCRTDPDGYKRLMDVYGTIFNDRGVINSVIAIVDSALNAVDPIDWINVCEDGFVSFGAGGQSDCARTFWGKWLLGYLEIKLEALLGEFKQLKKKAEPVAPYYETLTNDVDQLTPVAAAFKAGRLSWTDAFEKYNAVKLDTIKQFRGKAKEAADEATVELAKQIQNKRKNLVEKVREIKNKLFFDEPDSPLRDQSETVREVRAFCEIARDTYAQFQSIKAEHRLYDYGDMERKCLEILTDNDRPSELALSYRQKFSEVYVDEYQDTNELQERILDAICGTPEDRGPGAPFRFMVGDVKQSIYGFRGGCPDLFMDKYRNYTVVNRLSDIPEAISAGSRGVKILLGENFRSRREIIDSVNAVFDSVMNERTAGMPYGEAEHLIYGARAQYDASSGDPADPRAGRYRTEVMVIEGNKLKEDAKTVLEANVVAARIKQMVESGFEIARKDGSLRPVDFSDFTILMHDLKKVGSVFAEQLRLNGVPVKDSESRYGLFEYPEVRVLTAFLRILDNPLDDIPLLTVLTNIYGFEGELLARIAQTVPAGSADAGNDRAVDETDEDDVGDGEQNRKKTSICLYDKLRAFAESGQTANDEDTRNGAALAGAFLNRLDALRTLSGRRPAAETVWECMNENGFADAIKRQKDGGVGYGNLMRLLKLASGFDKSGRGGYFAFIRLLDMYESGDSDGIAAEPPEGSVSNAVSLSTIHRSKGLDYQIVFLSQTHKDPDKKEINNKLLTHKELGLGPTRLDKAQHRRFSTAMRSTILLRRKADKHQEELRILYVAMTRAHEKMIITGVVNNYQEFIDECAFSLDPDTNLPSDFSVIDSARYIKHVCMAALGKHGRCIGLRKVVPSPEAAEDAEKAGSADSFRFRLPPVPRWDPANICAAGEILVKAPPVKISVSEVKRLSNAALAGAEEDAGTTDLTLEQLTARTIPDLKPLDGGQISARNVKQAAAAGTLVHCCLEHIDFAGAAAAAAEGVDAAGKYVGELIAGLTVRGFFTEEDAELIERPLLTGFVCSEFVKELAQAEFVKREIPFTFNCDAAALLNEPSFAGRQTAVQGVIDCVYRTGGKLVLADYKSDRVEGGNYRGHSRRYLIQLSIYAEACRRRFGELPEKIVLYYLRGGRSVEITADELKRL